jgi:hypothetical protein
MNFVFAGHERSGAGRTGALLEVEVDAGGLRAHRMRRVEIDAQGAPHLAERDAPQGIPGAR